mmetsp:Transcript_159329/g.293662  ORF Transcript_159329/g.293662 Transcript_159329/m.293662 type:complete len:271 (+) Transcript_159329:72-884(+)
MPFCMASSSQCNVSTSSHSPTVMCEIREKKVQDELQGSAFHKKGVMPSNGTKSKSGPTCTGINSLLVFPKRCKQLPEFFFGHEAGILALLDLALLGCWLWSFFLVVVHIVQDFEQLLLGNRAGAFAVFYSFANGGQWSVLLVLLLSISASRLSGTGRLDHVFGDEACRLSVFHLLLRLTLFDFIFEVTISQCCNKFLVSEAFLWLPGHFLNFVEFNIIASVLDYRRIQHNRECVKFNIILCLAACGTHDVGLSTKLCARADGGQTTACEL